MDMIENSRKNHSKLVMRFALDTLTRLIKQAEEMWQPTSSVAVTSNPVLRLKRRILTKIGVVTSDRYQQQTQFDATVVNICYWLSSTMHQLEHYLQIEQEQRRQQQQSLLDTQQQLSIVQQQLGVVQQQLKESSAMNFRTRSMLQKITESQQEYLPVIQELSATQKQMQEVLQQLQARVEQVQGRVMDHAMTHTLLAEQIGTLQQVSQSEKA